ncbi:MAG: hypothetical protein ABSD64_05330 [Terriglobales bacterium]
MRGTVEQRLKTVAECGIVRRERRQHSGMINGFAERGLQLPHARNDVGIHERGEVLKAVRLVQQRAEFAQQLHIVLREYGHVGLGQDFQQRDFERRERDRSIQAIAALFPLASYSWMAKQKGRDQIGLVAIGAGIVAVAREETQQRLGHLGIKVRLHCKPQHGGSDRHIEKLDPELHLIEGGAHVGGAADDVGSEFGGRGQLSAELVAQQPLVEALHGSEQRQLPFGVLNQNPLLRARTTNVPKWAVSS